MFRTFTLVMLLVCGSIGRARAATLDGHWVVETAEADIVAQQDAGLATALASLPGPLRSIAGAAVRRSLYWCTAYEVGVGPADLHVACDTRGAVDARFGATPTTLVLDGTEVRVTATRDDSSDAAGVRIRLESAQGARESHLRIDGENLVLTVIVTSPRLDAPVGWTIRYRRA